MTKKINIELTLYRYDELSEDAKEKAFNEHEQFLRENPAEYEAEDGTMCYDDMDTWDYKDVVEYVEDSIRINDYWFMESGELADTVTYTGNHPKVGATELNIFGRIYIIKEVEE